MSFSLNNSGLEKCLEDTAAILAHTIESGKPLKKMVTKYRTTFACGRREQKQLEKCERSDKKLVTLLLELEPVLLDMEEVHQN